MKKVCLSVIVAITVALTAEAAPPPTKQAADAAKANASKAAESAVLAQEGSKKLYDVQTGRVSVAFATYLSNKVAFDATEQGLIDLSFEKLSTQSTSAAGYITAGDGCIPSGTGHFEDATKHYDDKKWGEAVASFNSAFSEYENSQGNFANANEVISDDLITLVETTLKKKLGN